jgi:ubiquinol-cytochrome c reductase cytochrome b subunit
MACISFIEKYKINIDCTSRKNVTNFNKPIENTKILEIIYGTLLGDGHAEKRKNGKGTRITFYQESSHDDYLLYLHSIVANLGYCNTNIPKIFTRLSKNGKIRKVIRFST